MLELHITPSVKYSRREGPERTQSRWAEQIVVVVHVVVPVAVLVVPVVDGAILLAVAAAVAVALVPVAELAVPAVGAATLVAVANIPPIVE